MKVITQAMVAHIQPGGEYTLPAGCVLSPGAQAVLRERRVRVVVPPRRVQLRATPVPPGSGGGYVEHETGRPVAHKPEHMTQLSGNRLVPKDHPRIIFRGKLDSLQAQVVTAQTLMEERGASPRLVEALEEVLTLLRRLLRAEVLEEVPPQINLLGLTPQELREQSHDPKKYFGVEPMVLPHRSMGLAYALLNGLRAAAREGEVAAVAAFGKDPTPAQEELLRAMNRLSSAFHILMCRVLAGEYAS